MFFHYKHRMLIASYKSLNVKEIQLFDVAFERDTPNLLYMAL